MIETIEENMNRIKNEDIGEGLGSTNSRKKS